MEIYLNTHQADQVNVSVTIDSNLTEYSTFTVNLMRTTVIQEKSKSMIEITIKFKRDFLPLVINTYLPTLILTVINQLTNYYVGYEMFEGRMKILQNILFKWEWIFKVGITNCNNRQFRSFFNDIKRSWKNTLKMHFASHHCMFGIPHDHWVSLHKSLLPLKTYVYIWKHHFLSNFISRHHYNQCHCSDDPGFTLHLSIQLDACLYLHQNDG